MNSQLLFVLIACAILLLLGGCFMLLAVAVFLVLRRSPAPALPPADAAHIQARLPTPAPAPARQSPPAPRAPPPPPAFANSSLGQAVGDVEDEGAKTEVFTRGNLPIDWDDDEEGEATEIFRADLHGDLNAGTDYDLD